MIDPHPIRKRFISLCSHLSERERRLYAAAEARAAGYGGIAAVSAATGIAVSTIGRGLKELGAPDTLVPDRVRRPGGGRKLLVEKDATLLDDLLALVEPAGSAAPQPSERGDPMSPLRWTCKSLSQLTAALVAQSTGSAARWWASCCTSRSWTMATIWARSSYISRNGLTSLGIRFRNAGLEQEHEENGG